MWYDARMARLRLWLPVLLWAGLIFWLSALPDVGPRANTWPKWLLRKGGHVFEYAVLSALMRRALPASGGGGNILLAVLYAGTDEWHQTFVPGREGRWTDVGIDALGAALGSRLWGRSRQEPQR